MNAATLSKTPSKPPLLFPKDPMTPKAGGLEKIKKILLETVLVTEFSLFSALVLFVAALSWLGIGLLETIEALKNPGAQVGSSPPAHAST
jgi:hypothetical protein